MPLLETQHARIPWRWVVLLNLVGQVRILALFASGSLIFTMRKHIDSPLIINSVSSLDVLFNLLVAAPCLYYSDRIWTHWGRRLPFVLVALLVMAVVLVLLPLAGSAVPMALLVVLWLIFWDVGNTYDSLIMEIIPPSQRGRSSTISAWLLNGSIMLSSVVIAGRFDDVLHLGRFVLRGETLIYWWGAACLVFCLLFLALFVRERPPPGPPPADHGPGLTGAMRNLFAEKDLWPVYLLVFSTVLQSTGLGAIDPLLTTEQWGYSKQEMGTNVFVGGVINLLVIIPLVGLIADRIDRLTLFGIGVIGGLLAQVAYYVFVRFLDADHRPSIGQMIFFGQLSSSVGQFSLIAAQPLIFEYIPRRMMGTAQAGLNFVRSITRLLTLNGIGLWVTTYSRWFLPEGRYDYFSGYLFMILMNLLGCVILAYFAWQVRRGRIRRLGLTEFHPVEESGGSPGTQWPPAPADPPGRKP